jgi:Ca-activated chloride channel homolog
MMRRRGWVGALAFPLLALAAVRTGAGQDIQPGTIGDDSRISVDVNLVVLHATVSDRRGQPVSGLQKQDFEVYEDGVPQPIRVFEQEDVPVTAGLVVDHSGSMRRKLAEVSAAVQ